MKSLFSCFPRHIRMQVDAWNVRKSYMVRCCSTSGNKPGFLPEWLGLFSSYSQCNFSLAVRDLSFPELREVFSTQAVSTRDMTNLW